MSRARVQEEYRKKFEARLLEAYEAGRERLVKEGKRPYDFEAWLSLQKDEGPYASDEEFYLEEGIV